MASRLRRGGWILVVALLATPAAAVSAEPPADTGPTPVEPPVPAGATPPPQGDSSSVYPFSARLRLDDQTVRETYEHPRDSVGDLPKFPTTSVRLGHQVARAYAVMLGRLFRPGGEGPTELVMEVSIEKAQLRLDADGWVAVVVHQVALRDAGGAELGRWRAEGRGHLYVPFTTAIPRAFDAAADAAAGQLELLLQVEPTEPWSRWQAAHRRPDVARPVALDDLPQRLRATRYAPRPPPPRSARLLFVEAGPSAVVAGRAQSIAGSLRVGWSGEWLTASASLRAWPTTFTAHPAAAWGPSAADLTVADLGVEPAWTRRLGNTFEVRLGGELHLLVGRGRTTYVPLDAPTLTRTASFSGWGVAGGLVAGATYVSPRSVNGNRIRLGLDLQRYLGASLHLAEARRDLTVAEWSLALRVGLEWPTAWPTSVP